MGGRRQSARFWLQTRLDLVQRLGRTVAAGQRTLVASRCARSGGNRGPVATWCVSGVASPEPGHAVLLIVLSLPSRACAASAGRSVQRMVMIGDAVRRGRWRRRGGQQPSGRCPAGVTMRAAPWGHDGFLVGIAGLAGGLASLIRRDEVPCGWECEVWAVAEDGGVWAGMVCGAGVWCCRRPDLHQAVSMAARVRIRTEEGTSADERRIRVVHHSPRLV